MNVQNALVARPGQARPNGVLRFEKTNLAHSTPHSVAVFGVLQSEVATVTVLGHFNCDALFVL